MRTYENAEYRTSRELIGNVAVCSYVSSVSINMLKRNDHLHSPSAGTGSYIENVLKTQTLSASEFDR